MVSSSKYSTNNEEILCISQTDQSAVDYLYNLTHYRQKIVINTSLTVIRITTSYYLCKISELDTLL